MIATETIWKFHLSVTDVQEIEMPIGAEILHLGLQHGQPCIWARLFPENPKQHRVFRTYGTGHEIEHANLEYIGTFQQPPFVWHVFEVKAPE